VACATFILLYEKEHIPSDEENQRAKSVWDCLHICFNMAASDAQKEEGRNGTVC
jgi:hypothetical protein